MDEEKDDKQEKELQKLLKYLKSKRDILAANIKSINQRWNQEYCWKLKQMNELKSSIKECDEKYTLVNSKNEELKNEK